jgi:hypothetical protein
MFKINKRRLSTHIISIVVWIQIQIFIFFIIIVCSIKPSSGYTSDRSRPWCGSRPEVGNHWSKRTYFAAIRTIHSEICITLQQINLQIMITIGSGVRPCNMPDATSHPHTSETYGFLETHNKCEGKKTWVVSIYFHGRGGAVGWGTALQAVRSRCYSRRGYCNF